MQQREILDETFDAMRTDSYDLLVRAAARGISLALLDPVRSMFIGLVDFPYRIQAPDAWADAFRYLTVAHPWASQNFRKVIISWRGQAMALAPEEFYKPEYAKNMLKHVAFIDDLDEVHTQKLDEQAMLLFTVPSQLLYEWRAKNPDLAVTHEDAALVKLTMRSQKKGRKLLIHLRDQYATAALINEQHIEMMRPIMARTPEDILYHIQAMLNTRSIDPIEVKYKLLGYGLEWVSDADPRRFETLAATEVNSLLEQFYLPLDHKLNLQNFEFSYLLEKQIQSNLPLFATALCV